MRKLSNATIAMLNDCYRGFDKAHNIYHLHNVSKFAVEIAKNIGYKDLDLVDIVARFHDIGLLSGKSEHEQYSAMILEQNRDICKQFTDDEISLMKKAILEHRTGVTKTTTLSKILYDADKLDSLHDIDRLIYRTCVSCYSRNLNKDEIIEKVITKIKTKYGVNGTYVQQTDSKFVKDRITMTVKLIDNCDKSDYIKNLTSHVLHNIYDDNKDFELEHYIYNNIRPIYKTFDDEHNVDYFDNIYKLLKEYNQYYRYGYHDKTLLVFTAFHYIGATLDINNIYDESVKCLQKDQYLNSEHDRDSFIQEICNAIFEVKNNEILTPLSAMLDKAMCHKK